MGFRHGFEFGKFAIFAFEDTVSRLGLIILVRVEYFLAFDFHPIHLLIIQNIEQDDD